ncbi:MAG: MFS transporter [Actinomycetota bacterium]
MRIPTVSDGDAPAVMGRAGRIAIFAVVFFAFLDNFALLPVTGPYAEALGAGPIGIAVAVAAYSLTNLAFDLIGGALVDRFGRRRTLVWSLAISPIALALYAAADSLGTLVALRVLHGAAGGMVTAAVFTVVGDIAPVGERGRYVGRAGALIGLAAIVGPAFGGEASARATGPDGFHTVFFVVAALLSVGLALTLGFVRETRAAVVVPDAGRPSAWRDLLANPMLRATYLGTIAYTFAVGTLAAFFAVDLQDAGYDRRVSGLLLALFGLIAVLVMLWRRAARSVDERGPVPATMLGLGCLAVSGVLLTLPISLATAAAAMVVYGIGYGFVFPAVGGAVTLAAPAGERGRAYGLFNVAFDLGISIGPLAGGFAAADLGVGAYVPAVLVCVAAIALLLRMRPGTRPTTSR